MYVRAVSVINATDWVHVRNCFSSIVPYNVGFLTNLHSTSELLKICLELQPDVVLMDPTVDGGEWLRHWREYFSMPPQLICVSSDVRFAMTAFEVGAVHYVPIPCPTESASKALFRLHRRMVSAYAPNHPSLTLHEGKGTQSANIITLPDSTGYEVRPADQIICAHAEGAYTRFIFEHEPQIIVSKSLGEFEETLSCVGMLRVHRSHMVSLAHIRKVARGKTARVILSTGHQVNVGSSYLEQLISTLNVAGRKRR